MVYLFSKSIEKKFSLCESSLVVHVYFSSLRGRLAGLEQIKSAAASVFERRGRHKM